MYPDFVKFPFPPVPKGRPRFSRATGTAFTDARTRGFEAAVAECWRESGRDEQPGIVAVQIELWHDGFTANVVPLVKWSPSKLRGDIDNYAKSILDGLQVGGAFPNDRNIADLRVIKH